MAQHDYGSFLGNVETCLLDTVLSSPSADHSRQRVCTKVATHIASGERASPQRRVLGARVAGDEVKQRRKGPQERAPGVRAHERVPGQPIAVLRAHQDALMSTREAPCFEPCSAVVLLVLSS